MKTRVVIIITISLLVGLAGAAWGQDSLNVRRVGFYTPGDACGVAVSGSYAYVADYQYGLRVVNVSNPASPVEVGYYNTPGLAWRVAVSGAYTYVADCDSGLRVVDVSNPANPVEVGYYVTPWAAYSVAVSGSYAYVADRDLRIVNVFNPANPVEVGFCSLPDAAVGVAVSGSYAYVADSYMGLRVVNVSNPASPVEVGHCHTPVPADGVAVSGNYAYVADEGGGLRVVDVSNPANPVEAGYINTLGVAMDVAVSGSYAYVAALQAGLRVVSVSNPAHPVEVGYYYHGTGFAEGVAVSDSYAYLADGIYFGIYEYLGNLSMLDVTLTPLNPPITVPAQGGSFQFTASVRRNVAPQAPFMVWARIKNPDGTYTPPTLGPVTINPPVSITVSRQRTQNVPGSWPAGVHTYLGYANTTFAYPAIDSSSFTFTKLATADGGMWITNASSCTGEPFPGEELSAGDLPPSSFILHPCSPNPFNPSTAISFKLQAASHVSLKVYDTAGRLVTTLVDGVREAGTHEETFDGSRLASGIYLAKLEAGEFSAVQKLVLMK